MNISKAKATDLIKGSKGKFINVKFVKKNGDLRTLTGRPGVYNSPHAPLTGEGMKYNPDDYGLVGIFDAQKKAYRMVNINTLQELTVEGQTYDVVNSQEANAINTINTINAIPDGHLDSYVEELNELEVN